MKTWLIHSALAILLWPLIYSAIISRLVERQGTSTTAISATVGIPPAHKPMARVDKTSSNRISGPTQADAKKQNYHLSTGSDTLQIKGSKTHYDIQLPTDVLFDFDQSTLRPDGISLLEKVKQHFVTHGVDQLHVWGHTDSKGNDQYNFKLSQRRAMVVANWLKKNIKTKGLIMSLGRGEQEPLVPNTNPDGTDNPENRQKNRRVTLSVVKYPNVNKMLNKQKKAAG